MFKKLKKCILFSKYSIRLYLKNFTFCIGWFSSEDFKLFDFTLFEYNPKCMFVILDIQIAKFSIEILIDLI